VGNREIGEAELWELFNFFICIVRSVFLKVDTVLEREVKKKCLIGRSPLRR
jgi:hypothetical protein